MKIRLLLALTLASVPLLVRADGVADYARAQLMFARVMNAMQQYKQVAGAAAAASAPEPGAPSVEPLTDGSGKFFSPYDEKGQLVGWAQKAIGANVGAAVGAKAGEKAGNMLAAKVPFGGLLAGAAKKKGKELGALTAVGGSEFVKSSSTLSFETLDELALYMHGHFAGNTDYIKGLAAALAIYPDLEKTYEAAIKKGYGMK